MMVMASNGHLSRRRDGKVAERRERKVAEREISPLLQS